MGIQEELKELKEIIQEKERPNVKEKKFRIPFSKKVGNAQSKKNYVTIMKIQDNGEVTFNKTQIDEQTIMDEGIPRLAGSDYILRYKKNPMIILPSWSTVPYSPMEKYRQSLQDGSNTVGYKILLNKMIKEQVSPKKQLSGMVKWILGLGLLGIIGYAIMTGGG